MSNRFLSHKLTCSHRTQLLRSCSSCPAGLPPRIPKHGRERQRISSIPYRFSRWRAVSPESQRSIPGFHADFLSFTQIFAAVWPNLPLLTHKLSNNWLLALLHSNQAVQSDPCL